MELSKEEIKEMLLFAKNDLKAGSIKIGNIECIFTGLSYSDGEDGHFNHEKEDEFETEDRQVEQEKRDYQDDLTFSSE